MRLFSPLVLLGLIFSTSVAAQAPVRVIVFPGSGNLPLWVAEDKGFLGTRGVSIQVTQTPNSVTVMESLMDNRQDVAIAAFDNVVAYQEGQGEVALHQVPDFFAFMGISRGMLRLVVQPDVKRIEDLRGKSLAVDAKATGFSLVLIKMLRHAGLGDNEYTLLTVGGTATRAQQLMENRFAGTILVTPLELVPESKGFRRLADGIDLTGPYQTFSGFTRRSWAAENRDRLVHLIRALLDSLEWIYQPANRTELAAIYAKHLPNLPPGAAAKHVAAMLGEREGFTRDGRLDPEGVRSVLALRSELGTPPKRLDDPSRYQDDSYYRAALAP